jgi:hypothetical protein
MMQHTPRIDEIPFSERLHKGVVKHVAALDLPSTLIAFARTHRLGCGHRIRVIIEAEYAACTGRFCRCGIYATAASYVEKVEASQVLSP